MSKIEDKGVLIEINRLRLSMSSLILFLAVINFLLGIGLLVYAITRKKKEIIAFLPLGFILSIWLFNNFLLRLNFTQEIFVRLAYGLGVLVPTSGLIWIYVLIRKRIPKFIYFAIFPFSLLIFLFTLFSTGVILSLDGKTPFGYEATAGKLFPLYVLFIGIIIALVLYKLITGLHREKDPLRKQQILYILLGSSFFATFASVVSFFASLIFKTFRFAALDNLSSSFFLILLLLAIVKKQLFSIKPIFTEALVILFSLALLFQIFISRTTFQYIGHSALFAIFIFIGYLLIKEVLREIKQKEMIAIQKTKITRQKYRIKSLNKKLKQQLQRELHREEVLKEAWARESSPRWKKYVG